MSEFSNEKQFDTDLSLIGQLYEDIKDNIRAIEFGYATEQNKTDIYIQLATLRDIAAMKLKGNHEINLS